MHPVQVEVISHTPPWLPWLQVLGSAIVGLLALGGVWWSIHRADKRARDDRQHALKLHSGTIEASDAREFEKWRREQVIPLVIEAHRLASTAADRLATSRHAPHEIVDDWPDDVTTGQPVEWVELHSEVHEWVAPAVKELLLVRDQLRLVASEAVTDQLALIADQIIEYPAFTFLVNRAHAQFERSHGNDMRLFNYELSESQKADAAMDDLTQDVEELINIGTADVGGVQKADKSPAE